MSLTDQKDRQHMRVYYDRLKLGLCPKCGEKRDAEGLWCKSCLKRSHESKSKQPMDVRVAYNRTLREKYRRLGLCPLCGSRRDNGHKICSKCLKKSRLYRKGHN